MREFKSFMMIRQPVDAVWAVMRDRLPEVAMRLDDVDRIDVLERTTSPDGALYLVNRWKARQKVPAPLQAILGAVDIDWLDRARWLDSTRRCEWSIQPSVLSEYVRCDGFTRYDPAMSGRGTRVTFEGKFDLRPGFLAGMPSMLEPLVVDFVESIVSSLIPRNLARAITAAGDLLAGSGSELDAQPRR